MLGDVQDGVGSSQVTSSAREGDLKIQIKMLREELTSAQEAAAAATGHAKQYETLAKSSDEAVKAMQVSTPSQRDLANPVLQTRHRLVPPAVSFACEVLWCVIPCRLSWRKPRRSMRSASLQSGTRPNSCRPSCLRARRVRQSSSASSTQRRGRRRIRGSRRCSVRQGCRCVGACCACLMSRPEGQSI